MSSARFIIGDSLEVLRSMPSKSVSCIVTSPPYLRKRSYLPDGSPYKAMEVGQELNPADFVGCLLEIMDEAWRVLRDDGTAWINLGDTASGSGGPGGDYNEGGLRDGQPKWSGSARGPVLDAKFGDGRNTEYERGKRAGKRGGMEPYPGWPAAKSVCWVPQLFGASLAYGRNMLSGEPCTRWVTRPPITWCKPNPPVGEILDKCREATELIVFATKQQRYWFDLDAIRVHGSDYHRDNSEDYNQRKRPGQRQRATLHTTNPNGVPPLDWWEIPTRPYAGAHFATFPPELIVRPIIAGCPSEICASALACS